MATFTWHGARIREEIAQAAELALDRTMAACVEHAKANHPPFPPASEPYERYANRTDFLTESIAILDPAHATGTEVTGQWGSLARFALYLEIGTSVEGPTAEERATVAGGDIHMIEPAIGPLMAPRPYLRPAMDEEYPFFAARIAAAYRGDPMP